MTAKQLTLFERSSAVENSSDCNDQESWKLYTDGSSKSNPGPSGIGFCLKKTDKTVFEQGFFVGKKTNNQAEYLALLIGIFFAKEFIRSSEMLAIYLDSQLIVRQMNGQYRVKDAQLKKLQTVVHELLKNQKHSFCHVYREYNVRADELANRGVDRKTPLPKKVKDLLKQFDIL